MKKINLVTSIDRILAKDIPLFSQVGDTVRISDNLEWIPIAIKPHAQLTISNKVEDSVRMYTAKLVFKTCEDLKVTGRWVYRCRLSDGRYLLIGSNVRPFTETSSVESRPENVTENQLNEVTVDWKQTRPVPQIVP